jgi:hypothetical protein
MAFVIAVSESTLLTFEQEVLPSSYPTPFLLVKFTFAFPQPVLVCLKRTF